MSICPMGPDGHFSTHDHAAEESCSHTSLVALAPCGYFETAWTCSPVHGSEMLLLRTLEHIAYVPQVLETHEYRMSDLN